MLENLLKKNAENSMKEMECLINKQNETNKILLEEPRAWEESMIEKQNNMQ